MWTPAWLGVEVDEALELGVEERAGSSAPPGPAATRMTFSTPVTPTRERLTSVAGPRAWTSRVGEEHAVDWSVMPRHQGAEGNVRLDA